MELFEAKVMDSTHLELSRPITAGRGRKVLVTVSVVDDTDEERRQWGAVSAASLQAAYGDSEPDYPASMVREGNVDYRA